MNDQILNRGVSGGDLRLFLVGVPFVGLGVGVAALADIAINLLTPTIAFIVASSETLFSGNARLEYSSISELAEIPREPSFSESSLPAPPRLS